MRNASGNLARRRRALAGAAGLAALGAALAATPALGIDGITLRRSAPTLRAGGLPSGLSVIGPNAWFLNSLGPGLAEDKVLPDGTPALVSEDASGFRFGDRPVDSAYDGQNLWITLDGAPTIVRRLPDGTYERDGNLKATARGISWAPPAPGVQSVVWFTEPGADAIGRITMNGATPVITETQPPALTGFVPDRIVALPNGTAVATSSISQRIVRLTPTAQGGLLVNDIAWPGDTPPGGIAAGRNDAVYFTQPDAGKVWRAAAGSTSATLVKGFTGLDQPGPIAVDAGLGLWVVDNGDHEIVRANARGERIPGGVYVGAPTEIEVSGAGKHAVMWAVDGANLLRGTLSQISRPVVAVYDTSLQAHAGEPIRMRLDASEQTTLSIRFLRGRHRCGTVGRHLSGRVTVSMALPKGCVIKPAAGLVRYRINMIATDLDGNRTAPPRVTLTLRP